MEATKRLALTEGTDSCKLWVPRPRKKKKPRQRSKPKRCVGVYKAQLLAYGKTYPYWVAYWRINSKTERKYFSIASLGSELAKQKAIETRRDARTLVPGLVQILVRAS